MERPAAEDSDERLAAGEETILVVEDNDDVRAVAVSLLEQLGYRTVAVESAAAALARLSAGEIPDATFTDVVLPGDMDGLALARTVKQRWPELPIVLTTGYAKIFETELEFPVLRKPYQVAEFSRVVAGLRRRTGVPDDTVVDLRDAKRARKPKPGPRPK